MKTTKVPFGQAAGGAVDLYTLENDNGVTVKITNYGGIVTSIVIPDRDGNRGDIVCGFDTLDGYFSEAYKANSPYFGCIVGRYAARIKDGTFTVDARPYQVATNDGPNHLHGGIVGFDKRVWDGTRFGQFRAFCCETSKYPNGPNIPGSPRSILEPGQRYDETTTFKFGW